MNWDTRERIDALVSERDRLKGQLAGTAEERNRYARALAGAEDDRDRARRIAVELEQQMAEVHSVLWEIYRREMKNPENGAIVACEALSRFDDITATALNDLVEDTAQGEAA